MSEKKIFTTPKIRKFARELGANVSEIKGTERKGRITEDDVKNYISNKLDTKSSKFPEKKIIEFNHSEFGEIEIKDIPRVKKIAAPHLVNSWKTIPHVTHHDEADITEMDEFRNSLTDNFTGEKKKITPLAFIIKALVRALKLFPNFNSSIDDIENEKMVIKKYFHIGIAVDTPHGLMVPKIRNVDSKNINAISNELRIISDKCRNLKIEKKEFFGFENSNTSKTPPGFRALFISFSPSCLFVKFLKPNPTVIRSKALSLYGNFSPETNANVQF